MLEEMVKKIDYNILKKHSNDHDRRKYIRSLLTEELLRYMFIEKNMTVYAICCYFLEFNIKFDHGMIKEKILEFKITDKLTMKDSFLKSKEKRNSTNLKKYGHINPFGKSSTCFEKRNRTVKEKYGVDNVFQLEETKQKIKKTTLERYGVEHIIYLSNKKQKNSLTKPHKIISNFLTEQKIEHKNEVNGKFLKFNEILNKNYCPRADILIENLKIVIEVYGDLWHANPKIYIKSDIIPIKFYGNISKIAGEIWKQDLIRQRHIESFGYDMLIIWQKDIDDKTYMNKIQEFINARRNYFD